MATRKAKTTRETKPVKTTRPSKKAPVAAKNTTPKNTRATKKTSEKKVVDAPQPAKTTTVSTPTTTRRLPEFKVKRAYLIAALILIALAGLAYYFRSLFIVATVNGQPINRLSYIKELENMSGQQAMNALVTKTLILQEAEKKNVTVSDEEVSKEITEIEKNLEQQGQNLDSVLTLQGLSRDSLREQIYLQKLIEKMVGDQVTVTDEEVTSYIETNQETLPEGQSEEEQQNTVREQLKQQKLNQQVQTWLQELQQNANINYWNNQ